MSQKIQIHISYQTGRNYNVTYEEHRAGRNRDYEALCPCLQDHSYILQQQSLLLNTEAKSQGFMSLLCFLSSSLPSSRLLCPALRAMPVSPLQFQLSFHCNDSYSAVMLTSALNLSHLLSKYSTNRRHEHLQKVPPNYSQKTTV